MPLWAYRFASRPLDRGLHRVFIPAHILYSELFLTSRPSARLFAVLAPQAKQRGADRKELIHAE